MNRKIVGVVAALLLASVGTFTLVAWAKSAEDRALAGERAVNVLVVKEAVPGGTRAEDLGERVVTEQVAAKVKAAGSVDDVSDLTGKVAAVDLVPGEQVLAARFVEPEVLASQSVVEVPDGLQEVTISAAPLRAVGGNLRPGDTIGLVATFDPFELYGPGGETVGKAGSETHFILHKVLVTRIQAAPSPTDGQQRPEAEEGEDTGPEPIREGELFITVAVDAPSVERIVFVQEFGRFWLTLEPETATEAGTRIVQRGNVYE